MISGRDIAQLQARIYLQYLEVPFNNLPDDVYFSHLPLDLEAFADGLDAWLAGVKWFREKKFITAQERERVLYNIVLQLILQWKHAQS